MNKIFKIIWSHASQSWVVVSELQRAKGKTKAKNTAVLAASAIAAAVAGEALALQSSSPNTLYGVSGNSKFIIVGQGANIAGNSANPRGNNLNNFNAQGTGYDGVVIGHGATHGNASGQVIDGVVIGNNAVAKSAGSVVIGSGATALTTQSVAVGNGANASSSSSVAVGQGATSEQQQSTSVGANATANGGHSTALGQNSLANSSLSSALGQKSTADGQGATAVGATANATATLATALGYTSNASAGYSTAIGQSAKASATGATSLGSSANASNQFAVALGDGTTASGDRSVAGGKDSKALGQNSVALGQSSCATVGWSTAVGSETTATATDASAFGNSADATAKEATAVGSHAQASGTASVALGRQANASGEAAIALGQGAKSSNNYSVAIGRNSNSTGNFATGVGPSAKATGNNSTALGNGANASLENSVALGAGSVTDKDSTKEPNVTVGNVVYNNFAGSNPAGVVSFGASGKERQLKNVAAGNISATSTDAINGSQLYQVVAQAHWNVTSAKTGTGTNDGGKVANQSVKFGDLVTLTAGDNINIAQNGSNFTISAKASGGSVSSTNLTVNNNKVNTPTAGDSFVNATVIANTINNVGWNIQENNKTIDAVTAGDSVNFVNGNGTIANVKHNSTTGQTSVSFDVATTGTKTEGNGTVSIATNGNGSNLVNGTTLVNAINSAAFNVTTGEDGGTNSGNVSESAVKAGSLLKILAGDNVNIKQEGNNFTISAKGSLTVATSDLTVTNGSVVAPDTTNGANLVNATTVANTINNVSWGLGGKDADNADYNHNVSAGHKVDFVSGDANTTSVTMAKDKADANRTIVTITTATPAVSYVIDKNGTPTTVVREGDKYYTVDADGNRTALTDAEKAKVYTKVNSDAPTTLTNVKGNLNQVNDSDNSYTSPANVTTKGSTTNNVTNKAPDFSNVNKNNAATVGDVLNAGWNLQTNGNATDFVRHGDAVNFNSSSFINVTATSNGTATTLDFNIKQGTLAAAPNVSSVTANNVSGNLSTPTTNGVATTQDVVNAVNSAFWRVTAGKSTGSLDGNATVETVKAGDLVQFTAGDNIIIKQDGKNFIISSKAPNVTAGSNVELKAGTNIANITTVANTTSGKDEVTINADGTTVSAGSTNVVVTKGNKDSNNITDYKVDIADNLTLGKNGNDGKDGSITVTGKDGNGVTIKGEDGSVGLKGKDGANAIITVEKGDGTVNPNDKETNNQIDRITYKDGNGDKRTVATLDDGWKVKTEKVEGSTGKVDGSSTTGVKMNDTVTLKAGNNIHITQDGQNIAVATSMTPTFNTVTTDNLQVNSGGNVNMGGNRVTNVADGKDDKDAVNVSQLKGVANNVNNVANQVSKLDKRVRGIGASAAAASSLPQVYVPGKSMVAAAAGGYSGASAVSVGYSRASDNGKVILKLQGTVNSTGHYSGGVGVGYQW